MSDKFARRTQARLSPSALQVAIWRMGDTRTSRPNLSKLVCDSHSERIKKNYWPNRLSVRAGVKIFYQLLLSLPHVARWHVLQPDKRQRRRRLSSIHKEVCNQFPRIAAAVFATASLAHRIHSIFDIETKIWCDWFGRWMAKDIGEFPKIVSKTGARSGLTMFRRRCYQAEAYWKNWK